MISGVHLLATLCLVIFTGVIFFLQVNNTYPNLIAYDRIRMHTIDRMPGDTPTAVKLVTSLWPSAACTLLTNISSDSTCVTARSTLQQGITSAMNCTVHRGQYCSVLAQVLTGVMQTNKTAAGVPFYAGKVLDSNYQATLTGFLLTASSFFRAPYMATQDPNMQISRFSLYIFINCAIFFNTAIHCLDKWIVSSEKTLFTMTYSFYRRFFKFLALSSLFIIPFALYIRDYPAANLGVSFLLIFPGLWSFLWYEFFLPDVTRPWIHPTVFCVILSSSFLLAMIENGVTAYNNIIVALLLAAAAGQLYLALAWAYMGKEEKKFKMQYVDIYRSKGTSYAIMLSVIMTPLIVSLIYTAPYAFTYAAPNIMLSPIVFAFFSVLSVLWLEHQNLENKISSFSVHNWQHISNAQLYSSAFITLFALFLSVSMMMEHLEVWRSSSVYTTGGDLWQMATSNMDPGLAYTVGFGIVDPKTSLLINTA